TALTIQGSINNTDSIDLNGAAKGDSVAVGAAGATLSGGGQVTLTDNSANIIDGAAAGDTLTNVDNTISGAGDIGDGQMNLINQAAGVIDATGTNALILDTGAATVTNIGLIETANTGGLTIDSAINNTGVIMADIGALTVKGAVSGSGSAVVDNAKLDFASTFNENVTFTGPGGALELAQSTAYAGTITGFTNNFDSSLALDDIAFTSGVTKATYIDNGMATGGVLTVTDGTHTARITLVGNYAADIFTVGADGTGGTTVMAGPRPPFHWAQAINGDFNTAPDWTGGAVPGPADNAILDPTGAAFTVTASTSESVNSIQLAANATLAITGGAFTASAGTGSGANAGLISVDDHTALDVGGAIANSGTIKVLGGGFYNSDLNVLAGGATLTGAGQVYLASRSFIYTAPGATLTNFDNTISGIGGIEAASGGSLNLINDAKGAIDGSGGSALTLNSGTGTITNDGLIEATGTAGVIISGGVIDGSGGGSILAANGGVVTLSGGSVVGGTLTTAGSGVILSDNGSLDGTHAAVHNTGALNIPNHQALAINGTIANAGTIGVLGGGFYDAYLVINAAGATLTGGGQVYLGGRGDIQSAAAGDTLTNFDNTISGAGVVGSLSGGSLTLINAAKGVIDGDTGLALRLASGTGTITNDGLIEATSAAGIVLLNGVIDGSGGGAILAANGGTVTLGGAVVAGGTLSAAGSGVLQATGGTLDGTNAAVHLAADLTIADRGGLTIEGTIDNAASIVLPGGGYGSVLATGAGGATLTGGGQVIISGGRSYIRSDAAGDTLTNFNNTISGAGTLGSYRGGFLNLVNDAAGVIEGDSASVLNLNPVTGTITNDGLIEGASRAGIRLSSGVIDGSGGGTILAADGGHVYLSGAD
ncbi:MAG TPA: hypothetical protein VFC47_05050, partial [Caulobacteraceae bacterium]|nr:hypothetical protein [Caulobacteraceae bacterium]